jgi:hypothetical protein
VLVPNLNLSPDPQGMEMCVSFHFSKHLQGPVVVVDTCNLSYSGSRDWDNCSFQGQPGQKLMRPISTNKPGVMVCTCNLSYAGDEGRRIRTEASPSQDVRPYLKK